MMPSLPPNYTTMDSFDLLEKVVEAAHERGILMADGASSEELNNAQQTLEVLQQELTRRISW